MVQEITTIKILKKTKGRLEHLKVYRRETYDEVLQKMLEILNMCKLNPERARLRLLMLDRERRRNLGLKEKAMDKEEDDSFLAQEKPRTSDYEKKTR